MRLHPRIFLFVLLAIVLASPSLAQVGPVRLTISPGNSSTPVGTPMQMTARFAFLGNKSGGKNVSSLVQWTSSNNTVASISPTGNITASSRGTVTITATNGPFHASTTFTVLPNGPTVSSISVGPANPSVPKGLNQQFSATATFSDTSTQDVTPLATWSSGDTSKATISSAGLARTLNTGPTTITASYGGQMGTTTLTVAAPVLERVAVVPQNFSLPNGLTRQFSAYAVYSDNSTVNVTNSSSWSSTNTGVATVNNTTSLGFVTSVSQGTTTISAVFNATTGSTPLNVVAPLLVSITLSPSSNALVPFARTLQINAIGHYTDGTSQDITNGVAWSSSNTAAVSVNGPGVLTGNTIGASATITAASGSINASVNATVVFSNANLNGHYAFQFNGIESIPGPPPTSAPFLIAGAMQADGNGNLLNGVGDFNGISGLFTGTSFTGTYSIGPDGRGTASLTTGDILRFVMTSSGTGTIIEFAGFASGSGTIEIQDSSAFTSSSLQGDFAFLFAGDDVFSKSGGGFDFLPLSAVGKFTSDSLGNIFNGEEDVNDAGTNGNSPFSGNYTLGGSFGSNGRGTATLTSSGGTSHFAFYIVNSNEVMFISTDAVPSFIFLGFAERRSSSSFSNGFLSGNYVFSQTGFVPNAQFISAGTFFANGGGTVSSGIEDENTGGTVAENVGFGGSYNVDSVGRGTATVTSSQGTSQFIFYVVSPSLTLFMDSDNNAVNIGNMESSQNGGFSTASLNGNFAFAFDGEDLTQKFILNISAQISANGTGNLTGTEDVNDGGLLSSNIPLSGSYSIESNGRGTANVTGSTTSRFHFYITSGNHIRIVEVDTTQLLLGFGLKQF